MSVRVKSVVEVGRQERPYSDEVITAVSEWMILVAQPTRLRLLDRLEFAGELHERALVDELSTNGQRCGWPCERLARVPA